MKQADGRYVHIRDKYTRPPCIPCWRHQMACVPHNQMTSAALVIPETEPLHFLHSLYINDQYFINSNDERTSQQIINTKHFYRSHYSPGSGNSCFTSTSDSLTTSSLSTGTFSTAPPSNCGSGWESALDILEVRVFAFGACKMAISQVARVECIIPQAGIMHQSAQ